MYIYNLFIYTFNMTYLAQRKYAQKREKRKKDRKNITKVDLLKIHNIQHKGIANFCYICNLM